MRVAITQFKSRPGGFRDGAEHILEGVHALMGNGYQCELCLVPMMTLTGPLAPGEAFAEGYVADLDETLAYLASECEVPLMVTCVRTIREETSPQGFLLEHGRVTPLARPEEGVADGSSLQLFELAGMRFVVAYTYEDLDDLRGAGFEFDAVIFVSSYAYALDDPASMMGSSFAESRFMSDAAAFDRWLIGVGSVGGYGTQVYAGASFAITPTGDIVTSTVAFEEVVLAFDIVHPEDHDTIKPSTLQPEVFNRSLCLWEALTLGVADYFEAQEQGDAALVVDGTLQSSVLATLATDALGPTHVHALVCVDENDLERCEAVRSLVGALRLDWQAADPKVLSIATDAKMRADLIEVLLARYAREKGAWVLADTDKTALALEGDIVRTRATAALLPLGDVYRSDVLGLARTRNTVSPTIPRVCMRSYSVPRIVGILEGKVSREEAVRRADITATAHVEWGRSISDVVDRLGYEELTTAIIERLHARSFEHATHLPCIIASTKPLFEALLPIGFAWRDRVRSSDERLRALVTQEFPEDFLQSLVEQVKENAPEGERQAFELMGNQVLDAFAATQEGMGDEETEGAERGSVSGLDRAQLEKMLSDVFGILSDAASTGALFESMNGSDELAGPLDPLTWDGPFSEN